MQILKVYLNDPFTDWLFIYYTINKVINKIYKYK